MRHLTAVAGLLVALSLACSRLSPPPATSTLPPPTSPLSPSPTPLPSPTRTPARPTHTPAPPWCSQDPTPYLDEVARIFEATQDVISYWNDSARGESELLEAELMIRDLIAETEALNPPADFEEMHAHFLNGMQANLYAIFGVADSSDEHLEGSNATFQEEFTLAWEEWDRALEERERQCR